MTYDNKILILPQDKSEYLGYSQKAKQFTVSHLLGHIIIVLCAPSCSVKLHNETFREGVSRTTPRQNVYACARLSTSGLFFSHTFQSKSPRASFCVQLVVQLFCFMLLLFLTILQLLKLLLWITRHRSLKQLVDQIQ